jgi:hypothetical protein
VRLNPWSEDGTTAILDMSDEDAEAALASAISTHAADTVLDARGGPDPTTWHEHYEGKPRTLMEWFARRRERALA